MSERRARHNITKHTGTQTQEETLLRTTWSAQVECNRCGIFGHQPERCFFRTLKLTFNKCGRIGHKAKVCKSRPRSTSSQPQHKSSDNSRFSKNWRAKTPNNDSAQSRSQSRGQSRGRSSSHHVDERESQDVSDASNHVDDSTSSSIMTVHSSENVPVITYKVEINGLPIAMELDSGSC